MLLTIDIGNTNITLGIFKGKKLLRRYTMETARKNYRIRLKRIFTENKLTDAIICSVVPQATQKITAALTQSLGKPPHIIGKDLKVPVKNLYRNPKQVGQDRLVNVYAGIAFYGAPLVVVDFGTAVTFDAVSRKKEYLGGMILPGLGLSLKALSEYTVLLPKVKLKTPLEFIGKDTKNSMLSGVVYGFSAMTESLAGKIKGKIGRSAKVVATGGNIGLVAKYCRNFDAVDINLTLRGLNSLYFFLKKKSRKNS